MNGLMGAHVTGNSSLKVKNPEELRPDEDWFEEYKVDLITVRTMRDWRSFRAKWFPFLDESSLRLSMDEEKLTTLQRKLRLLYHEKLYPTENESWVLALVQPQVFLSVESVRAFAVKNPEYPATWDKAFYWLCTLGFIKEDDEGRLFVDETMLAPTEGERIFNPTEKVGDHISYLLGAARGQAFGLKSDYKPVDWTGITERNIERAYKGKKIITH
jgi:hypothetical protein